MKEKSTSKLIVALLLFNIFAPRPVSAENVTISSTVMQPEPVLMVVRDFAKSVKESEKPSVPISVAKTHAVISVNQGNCFYESQKSDGLFGGLMAQNLYQPVSCFNLFMQSGSLPKYNPLGVFVSRSGSEKIVVVNGSRWSVPRIYPAAQESITPILPGVSLGLITILLVLMGLVRERKKEVNILTSLILPNRKIYSMQC